MQTLMKFGLKTETLLKRKAEERLMEQRSRIKEVNEYIQSFILDPKILAPCSQQAYSTWLMVQKSSARSVLVK